MTKMSSIRNYPRLFILLNLFIAMFLVVLLRASLIDGIQRLIPLTGNATESRNHSASLTLPVMNNKSASNPPTKNPKTTKNIKTTKTTSLGVTTVAPRPPPTQLAASTTPTSKKQSDSNAKKQSDPNTKTKVINFVNFPGWFGPNFNFSVCEETRCVRKNGLGHVKSSDMVAFYFVRSGLKLPPKRPSPNQMWVVAGWESPVHCATAIFSGAPWRNQINYTMSYHPDSDIFAPYGLISKMEKPRHRNYTEIMAKKKKMVAWVTRNCRTTSKRMAYMQELKKHINVDLYGGCGKAIPAKGRDIFEIINETYKFYLGFENSFCEGYITEKFFRRMQMDVILVVRGAGKYSKYLPKNSYINTEDFKSVKDLGKYLHYLDKNDTAYVEYLKAKAGFTANSLGENINTGICKMCEMVWKKPTTVKIYKNFHEWWSNGKCNTNPQDIH